MDVERRLRAAVEALCADECAGRAAGSREGAAARAVVEAALRRLGHAPETHPVPGSGGANVLARGRRARVLVGAHYDHIGRDGRRVYWGADDNAAAVAALLELAASLGGEDVVLAAFDAEEPPFFLGEAMGSIALVRDGQVPVDEIELAIVLDLVGHAVGPPGAPAAVRDGLFVLGAEKSAGTAELVAASEVDGLAPLRAGIDVIPPLSDYQAFRDAGVPFLFLTCGRWRHYHQPTDTPDRLDYRKLAAVAALVERLARGALARPPGRPAFDDAARDHAGTVESLIALARGLEPVEPRARSMRARLEAIRERIGPDGRCSVSDWSSVLAAVAALEQGLA